jgi:hypothetical protein
MSQKYAIADESGNINGFYDSEINRASIPSGAIQITDAQWQDCLANPGKWIIQAGALVASPDWPPPPPKPSASFGTFEASIHTDPALTDAVLGAFFGDTQGRGNLLMASLQFALASKDYTRVNRLYADMKTTPPTGMTAADVQAIGQHAEDAHFPITP